jgi:hypothetical protein
MDVRASEQAERVSATDDAALKYNGHGNVSAEFDLPKALWLRMVRLERTIEPDAVRHEEYRFCVERYRELFGAIRDVQHEVVGHLGGDAGDAASGEG